MCPPPSLLLVIRCAPQSPLPLSLFLLSMWCSPLSICSPPLPTIIQVSFSIPSSSTISATPTSSTSSPVSHLSFAVFSAISSLLVLCVLLHYFFFHLSSISCVGLLLFFSHLLSNPCVLLHLFFCSVIHRSSSIFSHHSSYSTYTFLSSLLLSFMCPPPLAILPSLLLFS